MCAVWAYCLPFFFFLLAIHYTTAVSVHEMLDLFSRGEHQFAAQREKKEERGGWKTGAVTLKDLPLEHLLFILVLPKSPLLSSFPLPVVRAKRSRREKKRASTAARCIISRMGLLRERKRESGKNFKPKLFKGAHRERRHWWWRG